MTQKITPEEVELGQTAKENWIRQMWSTRNDYTPTMEQIFRGLKDEHEYTALGYALREDYTPSREMISFVVEKGLPGSLRAYMGRPDVQLELSDYSHIFDSRAAEFRLIVGKHKEWVPTVDQLNRGLNDPAEEVRALFNEKRPFWERTLLNKGVESLSRKETPQAL